MKHSESKHFIYTDSLNFTTVLFPLEHVPDSSGSRDPKKGRLSDVSSVAQLGVAQRLRLAPERSVRIC